MSISLRRYELLLPLRFNDGQSVSDSLIADTLVEMEQRFGSVSAETQVIRGQWRHQGQSYHNELVRAFVDVEDTSANRKFFISFKTVSKGESVKDGRQPFSAILYIFPLGHRFLLESGAEGWTHDTGAR